MSDLGSLPAAARRWLERSAPGGQARLSHIAMSQTGTLESNERWLEFRSEATYRPNPLAFEWRARLKIMFGMWVLATDGHADGDGWGGAKLWGLKSVGGKSGPEVHATQLVRNIAELVWLPDVALADPALRWGGSDDTFEIRADAADREVLVRFDVDSDGDVTRAYSPSRPYDVPGGFEDAPWRYDLADHREIDGVRVPASVVATYLLPDEPWEYLRAQVVGMQRFPAAG
ncbi:MAG: DUF6544 family protein [Candidatus Limnocylindrales bacterium]